jgi:hypothetical protein
MSGWRPARGEGLFLFAPVEICPLLRVDRSRPPAAPKLITIRGYIDRRRATMAKTQLCWDVPPLLDAQLTQP